MIEPRKVLVCGGAELPVELHSFSRNLGKALMKNTQCTLVTAGLHFRKEGTVANDYIIAQAALDEVKATGADPATRIQTILPEKLTPNVTRFKIGNVITVPNTDARRRRYSMTLMCDVMVSIAGGDTTADIIDLAWLAGKPILPIAATSKASLAAWSKYGDDVAKRLNISKQEADELRTLPATDNCLVDLCIRTIKRVLRPQCFVAMPYGKLPLQNVYETIKAAVEEKGYQAVRVDQQAAIGNLTDAIWDDIRAAQIMIADLTSNRPNVYYELGIGHTLGRFTLLTIYNERGILPPKMPFNISHHRILPYGTLESLRTQLDRYLPAV